MGRLTDDERALHDDAERLDDLAWGLRFRADSVAKEAARLDGMAHGYAFRVQELVYDARGGMTAATERRRFEAGARWALDGIVFDVCSVTKRDDMTRENGWLFLGLSDQGGYR